MSDLQAALYREGPEREQTSPTPQFDGEAIIGRLLSELQITGEALVLVIDDVQELRSKEAFAPLELLLKRAPETLSVVLSSRRDPPFRLHQLRLEGQLTEIRAAQLQFD